MSAQDAANTALAYGTLGRQPVRKQKIFWAAMDGAVERVAPGMQPQEVANTLLAHAKLEKMPEVGFVRVCELG